MAYKLSGSQGATATPVKAAPTSSAPPAAPVQKVAVQPPAPERPPARLVSLDAFRGLVMTMLAAGGFGIAALATSPPEAPVWKIVNRDIWERIAFHFEHPRQWQSNFLFGSSTEPTEGNPWLRGAVSFWDLIQPCFMFIVGVAMPFSSRRRLALGAPPARRWLHAAFRAVVLVLMGVFLYSLGYTRTNWIFPNVLAQIGLGYLFAYAVLNLRWQWQVAAMAIVLIGSWGAFYAWTPPQDYDFAAVNASADRGEILEPPFRQWSKNGNNAHRFDVWFLNVLPRPWTEESLNAPERVEIPFEFNGGGYQTLNFVPSIATAILGLLCGQVLLSSLSPWKRVGVLLGIAILAYGIGLAAGVWACPIVKRIWTPSWALFSGGFAAALLTLFYILFDIFPFRKLAFPLVVVGMNSILMYLAGELLSGWVRKNVVQLHFRGVIEGGMGLMARAAGWGDKLPQDVPLGRAAYAAFSPIVDATLVFAVFWLVAWLLYRNRLFFRV